LIGVINRPVVKASWSSSVSGVGNALRNRSNDLADVIFELTQFAKYAILHIFSRPFRAKSKMRSEKSKNIVFQLDVGVIKPYVMYNKDCQIGDKT
jgi:hypothetical protein